MQPNLAAVCVQEMILHASSWYFQGFRSYQDVIGQADVTSRYKTVDYNKHNNSTFSTLSVIIQDIQYFKENMKILHV